VPGLGKLQGAPDAYDMSSFFAIPYAEPPVEALRWQPPKELTSWGADTLNATAFGKQCMQGASFGAPPPMDEDCLFLNVATPTAALSGGKKLPVMLWIHGGACERPAHRIRIRSLRGAQLRAVTVPGKLTITAVLVLCVRRPDRCEQPLLRTVPR
jgi:hypothetical protein